MAVITYHFVGSNDRLRVDPIILRRLNMCVDFRVVRRARVATTRATISQILHFAVWCVEVCRLARIRGRSDRDRFWVRRIGQRMLICTIAVKANCVQGVRVIRPRVYLTHVFDGRHGVDVKKFQRSKSRARVYPFSRPFLGTKKNV